MVHQCHLPHRGWSSKRNCAAWQINPKQFHTCPTLHLPAWLRHEQPFFRSHLHEIATYALRQTAFQKIRQYQNQAKQGNADPRALRIIWGICQSYTSDDVQHQQVSKTVGEVYGPCDAENGLNLQCKLQLVYIYIYISLYISLYIYIWVENSCLDRHWTVTDVEEYPKLFHSMCSSAKGITNRLVVPGWLQFLFAHGYVVSVLSGKWGWVSCHDEGCEFITAFWFTQSMKLNQMLSYTTDLSRSIGWLPFAVPLLWVLIPWIDPFHLTPKQVSPKATSPPHHIRRFPCEMLVAWFLAQVDVSRTCNWWTKCFFLNVHQLQQN